MTDLFLGLSCISIGIWLMGFGFRLWRILSCRTKAEALARGLDSGIYIKHGMTIDPKTGLVTPHQSPYEYVYRDDT
jgi:hypothetical protein